MKRRYGRRPRRRRLNRKFYRKRSYGRKKSYKKGRFGKYRKNSAIRTLFKAILPEVPVKSCGAFGILGTYGARTYKTDFVGDTTGITAGRDLLPGQSNIYDDGAIGTSTHLTFQQYAAKKMKAKHIKRYIGQNLGNTHMILTMFIVKPRYDYSLSFNPDYNDLFPDCLTSVTSGQDLLNVGSALPGSSNIDNYCKYPQFTPFMSAHFTSNFKVVKSYKMRLGPSEWFRLKLNTGYKEFDKKWLLANEALGATTKLKLLSKFSKFVIFSWHGEAITKPPAPAPADPVVTEAAAVNTVTLSKCDLMVYYNQTWTYKAIPYHRKATILALPTNLHTEAAIAEGDYVVRPSGVVQITETSHAAKPE